MACSRIRHRLLALVLVLLPLWFVLSCEKSAPLTEERFALGTLCRITVWGKADLAPVWKAVGEVEECLSAKDPGSELSNLNRSAGRRTKVSPLLWETLDLALGLARESDGAFNPALGAVVELWGIGTENQKVPGADELGKALQTTDFTKIQLERGPDGCFVSLGDPRTRLDLGGIGKGIACDMAAAALRSGGVESALLNFGGNVYCLGGKPDGKPFIIGIREPFAEAVVYRRTVEAADQSVVTSGPYEKFFIAEDGSLRHHILDGKTGFPAASALGSVTIVGEKSAICDGLATACYVLGEEKSKALLGKFPGYRAVFLPWPEDGPLVGPK